jgi:hypothetical protein
MAQCVVDALEMIEVEAEHREQVAAFHPLELVLEPLAQQQPVRKIGQRVVARHVSDPLLDALALGDVIVRRQPAATRERLVQDRNDPAVVELDDRVAGSSLADAVADAANIFGRITGEGPGRDALLQQAEQRASRPGGARR